MRIASGNIDVNIIKQQQRTQRLFEMKNFLYFVNENIIEFVDVIAEEYNFFPLCAVQLKLFEF